MHNTSCFFGRPEKSALLQEDYTVRTQVGNC